MELITPKSYFGGTYKLILHSLSISVSFPISPEMLHLLYSTNSIKCSWISKLTSIWNKCYEVTDLNLSSVHWVEFRLNDKTVICQFLNTSIHLRWGKRKTWILENGVFNVLWVIFEKKRILFSRIITLAWILANYITHISHEVIQFFIKNIEFFFSITSQKEP